MYEWKPAKSILPQAKPATHEKFKARKKQQQQAGANEDPEDWNSIPIFVTVLPYNKYCVVIIFIIYFRL